MRFRGILLRALMVLVAVVAAPSARALTNGLALTPPMGWNSWNHFGCNIDEGIIRSEADAMATNGMRAAGYQFINIDDCWQISRDRNGVIVADPGKFPSGIPALADYVHSKGLQLGIYSDHGTATCQGRPGGYGHEYLDALTYASWGVDYLKYDNCNLPPGDMPRDDYARMSDALMASGRPITFSICAWGFASWDPDLGNLWRTTGDISDSFSSMVANLNGDSPPACLAGPGRWNDPDMLEVGNGVMTDTEYRSHFSLWCILAAPLIAGNDLTALSPQTLAILTNPEAIAVDQDPVGEQGIQVAGFGSSQQVWCKPLGTDFNAKAVALFNTGGSATNITTAWTSLGLRAGPATVRDLWAHADLGTFANGFTTPVPSHGTVLLKVVGAAPALPVLGTDYLSDLQPAYAYTGWGTITRDRSIDGSAIKLNGTTYPKGIGVNSYSGVEYRLGGVAARFQSDIGVGDEVGGNGSVVFQVFADGLKIYDSGVMRGGAPHKSINLDVTGVNRLTLGVNDADDGNAYDHADWAGARVIVSNSVPAAPPAPVGLTAAQGNPVRLQWDPTAGAASYYVKRSVSAIGPFTNIADTVFPNYEDGNVAPGTTYYYAVSAVGKFGESADSIVVGALACSPPAAPTNLAATVKGTDTVLEWKAVPGATGYRVARAASSTPFSVIAAGLAATNYTDTNLAAGTTYEYAVAADNGCSQSALSAYVFATSAPQAPTALVAAPGGNEVMLSWNPSPGAFGYKVKRADAAAGPYLTIATNTTSLPYLDTGLIAGMTYFYEVSALNTGGESPDSAYASATPCGGTLPAGWADRDIGNVGFNGSASSCNTSFIVQGGGADIWNNADAFNYVSTSVAGNVTLAARVLAIQDIDPWSKAAVMFRSDDTAGSAFVDLIATPGNGINLQWRSSSGGGCGSTPVANVSAPVWLKLVRSGGTFSAFYSSDGLNWTPGPNTSVGMANNFLAGLAVTAHNNSSLCLAAFDGTATAIAPAPAGLTAVAGDRQVELSWAPVESAIVYYVKISTASSGPYTILAANWSATTFTVTGLANGTPYYFEVSAINAVGEGGNSSPVSATPAALVAPVIRVTQTGANVAFAWSPAGGHLQTTLALGGTNRWLDLGANQPWTLPITNRQAFFRVSVP